MPSDRTRDALRDMAEHIDLAIGFTAAMDLAGLRRMPGHGSP